MVNFYHEIFTSITKSVKDTLFPKQCLNCNTWGLFFCVTCVGMLALSEFQRCIICQHPSASGATHPICQTNTSPDGLLSIFSYQDKLVSKAINTAKLALVSELFIELANFGVKKLLMSRVIDVKKFSDFVLCPIPLTRHKQRFRGFNQSKIIAQIFANQFELAIDPILIKPYSTKEQKVLNKEQRQKNLQNSFQISIYQSLPKKVLLIDDITTTGSTFIEASKVLKQAGVKIVWCLALAQD